VVLECFEKVHMSVMPAVSLHFGVFFEFQVVCDYLCALFGRRYLPVCVALCYARGDYVGMCGSAHVFLEFKIYSFESISS
jgi:hypothetical protein